MLAIDTACGYASVAFLNCKEIIGVKREKERNMQAENLPYLVSSLLNDLGFSIEMVDRFLVTIGPGSFTGVRIALSYAYGIEIASGKSVIGVTTLQAIAQKAMMLNHSQNLLRASKYFYVCLPAGRNEFYCQRFVYCEEGIVTEAGECFLGDDAKMKALRKEGFIIVGSGGDFVEEEIFCDAACAGMFAACSEKIISDAVPYYFREPDVII